MPGSLNKVTLIGRVGKDPEIVNTANGTKIAKFSLAVSESYTDKRSGERKENTEWCNIVVYAEKTAEVVEKYVQKGALLYVEGKMQTRKYQDRDGADRYTTEVVVQAFGGSVQILSSPGDKAGEGSKPSGDGRYRSQAVSRSPQRPLNDDLDDQIPF